MKIIIEKCLMVLEMCRPTIYYGRVTDEIPNPIVLKAINDNLDFL